MVLLENCRSSGHKCMIREEKTMNVLWITNIPIGDLVEIKSKPMGGLWMDALLKYLKNKDQFNISIVTSSVVDKVESQKIDGVNYYLIPGGFSVYYHRKKKDALQDWKTIFDKENPDVIQVWGTEYSHALYGMELAKERGIPSVVYIQGVMKAVARYATGYLSMGEMFKHITLRDIYRGQLLPFQNKWFEKRAKTEKVLLDLAQGIIIENRWAESLCLSINPDLHVYKAPLNINDVFYQSHWTREKMVPHTIVCNASGPAYKGLHMLLKALVMIKKRYPDVKLYVPGESMLYKKGFERQKHPGYYSLISDFIFNNNLESNVEFTGYLTQKQLAEKLETANVFVLPSAIENHSSSLKEALIVGTPCVTSQVGGIVEYFEFARDGFSYRYEDYECIAKYVMELFENQELCVMFSHNSREIRKNVSNEEISQMIVNAYFDMVKSDD